MKEPSRSEFDASVQDHVLFDADVNSMEIRSDRAKKAKSGTQFDEVDYDDMTLEEQKQFTKMEHLQAGDEAAQVGNTDLALFEYVKALVADSEDVMSYFKIGLLHEVRGNSSLAEEAYDRALRIEPEFIAALERLGRMKLNERNYTQAKLLFQKAIIADQMRFADTPVEQAAVDTKSPFYAYNGMAVIEDLNGVGEAAASYYKQAAVIRPKSATLANNVGYSHYLRSDYRLAEQYFSRAIELNYNYDRAVRNLALIMVRESRYREVLDLLTEHSKDKSAAFNTIGYICMLDGKYVKADEYFNKAIDVSPTYFEIAYENRERNRELYSKTVYENLN